MVLTICLHLFHSFVNILINCTRITLDVDPITLHILPLPILGVIGIPVLKTKSLQRIHSVVCVIFARNLLQAHILKYVTDVVIVLVAHLIFMF